LSILIILISLNFFVLFIKKVMVFEMKYFLKQLFLVYFDKNYF